MRHKIRSLIENENPESLIGEKVTIMGWLRTIRDQKSFFFMNVNDGSSFDGIQVVGNETLASYKETLEKLTTGCSVKVSGTIVESQGKNQKIEIQAEDIFIYGACDSTTYPLQKKRHSFEFLRTLAHIRPRTNTFAAVARVRNALAYATHKYFQEKGFYYIHTPIITASDCEGGGEMFHVTTYQDTSKYKQPDGSIDYSQDFFEKPTFLTVSGQLNGESYASALSDIYTFGPTFRAENSHTSRHLAEFWMIEPEMAFCDLQGNIDCAEEYLKYLIQYVLKHCIRDMEFFNQFIEKGLIDRLEHVEKTPFERISYTEAISLLEKSSKKFTFPFKWGLDLQSEHERFLSEEQFKKPVVITDYPSTIKAFYMRQNDDDKTVSAMDVLVPKIGEIIGGSQREERLDILEQKIESHNLEKDHYWWYLELRKFGTVPHSGFGLGFERLVQFVTGMENIRDVIPFPRYPGHADF